MAILLPAILAAIGDVGAEIFSEMSSKSWEIPGMTSIREFGAAVGHHPGVGRSRNEDRAVVAAVDSPGYGHFRVAMVCDGVGGSEMGDAAAALAVATFIGEMARGRSRLSLKMQVIGAIRKADDVVRSECKGRGATTLSVLTVSRTGECVAANVGDSRIFSWGAKTGQIEQVSVDDTFENEMRDLKVVDPSLLYARGLRGSLSQAIGESGRRSDDLEIRTVGRERLTAGAILATDGAWKGHESGFNSIAMHADSANAVVTRLVNFALWTGGADNISVTAIDNLDAFMMEDAIGASTMAQSRVTLWTGGKTVTICCNPGLHSAPLHERTHSVAKKRKSRRAKRIARTPGTPQEQVDARDSGPFPPARPHIEVSTDEHAT